MAELARGTVGDRPWGRTLGALGLRGLSGAVTLAADGKKYKVAFANGAIVGAASPLASDAAARIALTSNLVSSSQVSEIVRQMQAAPARDEIEVISDHARLGPEQALRLRRRVVAQRAARSFSVDRGDFVVEDELGMQVVPGTEMDVRAVIYLGARQNLSEARLAAELGQLGAWFKLKAEAVDDLVQFGFSAAEKPVLELLLEGANLGELEAAAEGLEQRTVRAVVYALAACGGCETEMASRTPSRSLSIPAGVERARGGRSSTPPGRPAQNSTAPPVSTSRTPTPRQVVPSTGRTPTPDSGVRRSQSRPPVTAPPRPTPIPEVPARSTPAAGVPIAPRTTPAAGIPAVRMPIPAIPREAPRPSSAPANRQPISNPSFDDDDADDFAPPAVHDDDDVLTLRPAAHAADLDPASVQTTNRLPTLPSGAATPVPRRAPTANDVAAPPRRAPTANDVAAPPRRAPTANDVAAPPRRASTGNDAAATPPRRASTGNDVAAGASDSATVLRARTRTPSRDPAIKAKQITEIKALIAERAKLVRASADHFSVLGVPPASPPEVIRAAYFGIARQLHPDKLAALGLPDEDRSAHMLFARVNTAFAVLNDPRRRYEYEGILARGGEAAIAAEQAKAEELATRALEAENAYRRGEMALRRDQLTTALTEFKRALELDPETADYAAMVAWVQFCASPDKMAAAKPTRDALDRAIKMSPRAVTAYVLLGRMERMVGRDLDAQRLFEQVLKMSPGHADAASEMRAIEARLAKPKR